MNVERGWKPEESRQSVAAWPFRPARVWLLLTLTAAASGGSLLFAALSAERGWAPDSACESLQSGYFP